MIYLRRYLNSLGHRVKLSMLAKANFGSAPEGNLMKSVNWYKQGNTTKVKDYCEQDVKITDKLFIKACKEQHLKWHWHNKEERVETLDTSYWYDKAQKISLGEFIEESPTPAPAPIDDVLDLSFMMTFKMRMKNADIGNGTMTHDPRKGVLGADTEYPSAVRNAETVRCSHRNIRYRNCHNQAFEKT